MLKWRCVEIEDMHPTENEKGKSDCIAQRMRGCFSYWQGKRKPEVFYGSSR